MSNALRQKTAPALPVLTLLAGDSKTCQQERSVELNLKVSASSRSKELIKESVGTDGLVAAATCRFALGQLAQANRV